MSLSRAGSAAQGFTDYQETRRFDAIQELRTISVVLVVASHMQDPLLHHVHGAVTVFFVVSGFIITTLFLREEDQSGRVSLSSFYIRRVFRLLPMYLVVLALFAILILGFHLGGQVADFRHAVPYYLTYQNELAPSAPYGQTWSLAVDEKFYVLWPLLVFVIPALRRHRMTTAVLLLAGTVAAQASGHYYFSMFAPIIAGCIVAMVLHSRRGFMTAWPVTHPAVTLALVVGAVAAACFDHEPLRSGNLLLTAAVALALPGVILGRGWLRGPTRARPLVSLGKYTYGVYLIHPLVKSSIDVVEPAGQSRIAVELARYALTLILAFAIAAPMYHLLERPLTMRGRRIAKGLVGRTTVRRVPRTAGLEGVEAARSPGVG